MESNADEQRPHEVHATPAWPFRRGEFIHHCAACGYVGRTPPPIPCTPSPEKRL